MAKKTKNEEGIVAFSKIKTASVVRMKKQACKKTDESISVAGPSAENAKEHSQKNQKQLNEVGRNSLLLLGNYDSSSNSDDSD